MGDHSSKKKGQTAAELKLYAVCLALQLGCDAANIALVLLHR